MVIVYFKKVKMQTSSHLQLFKNISFNIKNLNTTEEGVSKKHLAF